MHPKAKQLGIWMDHSSAHLMAFSANPDAAIAHDDIEADQAPTIGKGEIHIQNKEDAHHAAYYKELGAVIKEYDEVLLFGPTDAKHELFNILRADSHFEHIKIEVAQTDKLTDNQMHAFVREHFSKN